MQALLPAFRQRHASQESHDGAPICPPKVRLLRQNGQVQAGADRSREGAHWGETFQVRRLRERIQVEQCFASSHEECPQGDEAWLEALGEQ